jgi:hypothetical protein
LHEELELLLTRAKRAGAMTIVGTILTSRMRRKILMEMAVWQEGCI